MKTICNFPMLSIRKPVLASLLLAAAFGVSQPASAIDFKFSFRGVEGLITRLSDNSESLPLSVQLLASPSGRGLGSYYNRDGPGFTVSSGQVVDSRSGRGTLFRTVPPGEIGRAHV